MVVNLTATYINEYLEFSYETPLRGLVSISSFTDNLTGSTGTRFFDKEFSYTLDGIKYSDWEPLTLLALQAISGGTLPIENDFILRFRYTRLGTDLTGDLTINSLVVNGTYSLAYLQILDLSNSIFEEIGFTDQYWNRVWINLLGKLYDKGIVPSYIVRGDDDPEDEDYITYWKTIAYFYALTIALVDEKISKITTNQSDFSEFLVERGEYAFTDNSIVTLNFVANYIFDRIRQRATLDISKIDGTHLAPISNPNHGALLRLLSFDINDEFLFEYIKKGNGWYLDVNSCTYNGLYGHRQLNKNLDKLPDGEVDLANYVVSGTVALVTDGSFSSVARLSPNSSITTLPIKANDDLSYEVTFWLRTSSDNINFQTFTLSAFAYTSLGTPVGMESIELGTSLNTIISAYAQPSTANYYFVRAIIFGKSTALKASSVDYQTNLKTGVHLRMVNTTQRLEVKFESLAGAGNLLVRDIKVTPLSQPLNHVFLNNGDMTLCWAKNRNFEVSSKINTLRGVTVDEYIDMKIRETLIPFGSGLIRQSLS